MSTGVWWKFTSREKSCLSGKLNSHQAARR